jgi:hypothetical protein
MVGHNNTLVVYSVESNLLMSSSRTENSLKVWDLCSPATGVAVSTAKTTAVKREGIVATSIASIFL